MLRILILILLCTLSTKAQEMVWGSKVLQKSSEFVDNRFPPTSRFRAAQILGPPSILPNTESSSASWRPVGITSGEDYVKVQLEKPTKVKQIVVGETIGPGAVGRIFGYTASGNEILLFQNDGNGNKKKGGILNIFIPETSEEIVALKMLVVHSLNKVPKEYDCLGVSNDLEPYVAKINVAKDLPKDLRKDNLGSTLNSKYSELAPLVSADGKSLYFTRLNHPKNYTPKELIEENGKKGNFTQDVWVSKLNKNGNWEAPRNMETAIHNRSKNAVATIAMDGNSVYALNVERSAGNYETGLTKVTLKDNKWINKTKVNIQDFEALTYYSTIDGLVKLETEYSMSSDEKFLIMGLVRKDTYGDKDLYVSFKIGENQYSKPLNLGKILNTAGNEGSPFLAADNKTLYFNSNGHPGYGHMDIFMTTRLDDSWTNWSTPINLGPQINSPEFDGYISIPASGEYAYFSSAKNSIGLDDIFKVKLFPSIMPDAVIMMEFQFVDERTDKEILPQLQFINTDKPNDETLKVNVVYDDESKTFKTVIPVGYRYAIKAISPGYIDFDYEINAKRIKEYKEINEKFKLKKVVDDEPLAQVEEESKVEKEKAEKEKLALEKRENERLAKESIEKEKQEKVRLARETAEKEKAEKERLALEKRESERLAKENVEKEKQEKVRLAKETADREKAEKERLALEKREAERLAKENIEKEKQEKVRLAKETADREKAEKERLALEKREAERLAKENIEKEKQEKVRLAQETAEKEKAERERLALEKREAERLAKEALEREGLASTKKPEKEVSTQSPALNKGNPMARNQEQTSRPRVSNTPKNVSTQNETPVSIEDTLKVNFNEEANNVTEIVLEPGSKLVLKEVFFDQSKADLKDESFNELNRIIQLMKEHPEMVVLLEGHTDNQGDVDLNFQLARQRIDNVKNFLVKKGGIDSERIQVKAWGQYRPLVKNFTEEQRRKNRRVEFTIIKM